LHGQNVDAKPHNLYKPSREPRILAHHAAEGFEKAVDVDDATRRVALGRTSDVDEKEHAVRNPLRDEILLEKLRDEFLAQLRPGPAVEQLDFDDGDRPFCVPQLATKVGPFLSSRYGLLGNGVVIAMTTI
jgi:hypothetical protein